ncbi:hypothetical protein BKA66DRAFT_546694 [Pyrenochaeta sp. MPI-SDFR-AT-0127]|nr:hypothetical protein BKA66DRAFT_546694 [Pyrenochaeta sp. MPI-SDFR-AT-0127]
MFPQTMLHPSGPGLPWLCALFTESAVLRFSATPRADSNWIPSEGEHFVAQSPSHQLSGDGGGLANLMMTIGLKRPTASAARARRPRTTPYRLLVPERAGPVYDTAQQAGHDVAQLPEVYCNIAAHLATTKPHAAKTEAENTQASHYFELQ